MLNKIYNLINVRIEKITSKVRKRLYKERL